MPKEGKTPREDSSKPSSDSRFNVSSDPRYKFTSKDKTRLKIDARFGNVAKRTGTFTTAKRDPYGRKINVDHKKKALKRLYAFETEDQPDDDVEVKKELAKANGRYDPARHGGFESSSDEDDADTSSGEDEEEEDAAEEYPASASMQRLHDEAADVEVGEVTNRIAIVNLDWDHVKAVDLLAVFSSFSTGSGSIEKVSIYPSEFGKERMQREEMEGPPKELFKPEKDNGDNNEPGEAEEDEEDDKHKLLQEGNDQDFDTAALRTYQLDRLRYYYAVMVCSDKETAKAIYDATDGREYLSSSNFIDLRFIPDDTVFDEEPHDECDNIPKNYKPVEFVTHALQHSKVQLTWDMHPEEAARKDSIKRAFTGGKDSLLENDLNAYLASESEDDGNDEYTAAVVDEAPLSKKELARRKLREKLGLSDEPAGKEDNKGPVGAMTVTFGSALIPDQEKEKEQVEETTIEKYKRKERERRERRQAERQAKKQGNVSAEAGPQHVNSDNEIESDVEIVGGPGIGENGDDTVLGFDDPFFTTAAEEPAVSKTKLRKEERRKKREAREAEEAAQRAEREQLALLVPNEGENGREFDMRDVKKAEKQKGKKGKNHKKKSKRGEAEEAASKVIEDIEIKMDERFPKAIGVGKKWALDASQPEYMRTAATKKLAEEMRRKRKEIEDGEAHEELGDGVREKKKMKRDKEKDGDVKKKRRKRAEGGDAELQDLVAKVKMKSRRDRR